MWWGPFAGLHAADGAVSSFSPPPPLPNNWTAFKLSTDIMMCQEVRRHGPIISRLWLVRLMIRACLSERQKKGGGAEKNIQSQTNGKRKRAEKGDPFCSRAPTQ